MQTLVTSTPIPHTETSRRITLKSRSNFSSSFIFLPAAKRRAIEHVYAFFRVVDDVVDEQENPVYQRQMVAWWREALELTYEGSPPIPLLKELRDTIERFRIPKELFLSLIEGCEMDIGKKRYETFDELYDYCYRVASVVGLVCMRIFEYKSRTSEKSAVDLGVAFQLTNIIRDVGVDLDNGRIYIPQEELRKFGVSEAELLEKKSSARFRQLMEFQYRRAARYFDDASAEFARDDKKQLLAARIMATVYRHLLEKIRKKSFPVLEKRLTLSLPEKMFLLGKSVASTYLR